MVPVAVLASLPGTSQGLAHREEPSSFPGSQNVRKKRVFGECVAGLCPVTEPL